LKIEKTAETIQYNFYSFFSENRRELYLSMARQLHIKILVRVEVYFPRLEVIHKLSTKKKKSGTSHNFVRQIDPEKYG